MTFLYFPGIKSKSSIWRLISGFSPAKIPAEKSIEKPVEKLPKNI